MKRSLKALLLAGAAMTALVGPAATPAQAQSGTCVGISHDSHTGETRYGLWPCTYCPSLAGLGDGQVWVVTCFT